MLKIDNVSIKYVKQFYSLFEVSGEFYPGDKIMLVGDNNSGNKALLRIIAKIDKPSSGKVDYDNFNKKELGYLPSIPVVFKRKTALENVLYSLKIRKVKKEIALEKAKSLLNEYNYQYLIDKKMSDCSDKEKYVVSLLRLLVREPRLTLIELPDNVDEDVIEIINRLIQQSEICLISSKSENENIVHTKVVRMYNGSFV